MPNATQYIHITGRDAARRPRGIRWRYRQTLRGTLPPVAFVVRYY